MSIHAELTGADLHEPKGITSAPANTVYRSNGSGSGSWGLVGTDMLGPALTDTVNHVDEFRNNLYYIDAPNDGVDAADTAINAGFASAISEGKVAALYPGQYRITSQLNIVDGLMMDTSMSGVVFVRDYAAGGNTGLFSQADFTTPVFAKVGGFTIKSSVDGYLGNSICLNLDSGSILENIHCDEWYGSGGTQSRMAILAGNNFIARHLSGITLGDGGGIRGVAGENVNVDSCFVYCSDDCFQLVPQGNSLAPLFGDDMVRWTYSNCIGYSGRARVCVAGLTGQVGGGSLHMTSSIRHCAFRNILGRSGNGDTANGACAWFVYNDESTGVIEDLEFDCVHHDCTLDENSANAGLISATTGTGGINFVKFKGGSMFNPPNKSVRVVGTGLVRDIHFDGFDFGRPRTSGQLCVNLIDIIGGSIRNCRAVGNGADVISLGAGGATVRNIVVEGNDISGIDNGFEAVAVATGIGTRLKDNIFRETSGQTTARAISISADSSGTELGRNDYSGMTIAEPVIYSTSTAGRDSLTPMRGVVQNLTSGATLRRSESGITTANDGAVSQLVMVLPVAQPGFQYSFVNRTASGIRVDIPGATDVINVGTSTSTAGGYIESSAIGDTVTVVCAVEGKWDAIPTGTWSVST